MGLAGCDRGLQDGQALAGVVVAHERDVFAPKSYRQQSSLRAG